MDNIGIDLGGRESQVCVRNSEGAILEEARRPTRALGTWLATRAEARVIVETRRGGVERLEPSVHHGFVTIVLPRNLETFKKWSG